MGKIREFGVANREFTNLHEFRKFVKIHIFLTCTKSHEKCALFEMPRAFCCYELQTRVSRWQVTRDTGVRSSWTRRHLAQDDTKPLRGQKMVRKSFDKAHFVISLQSAKAENLSLWIVSHFSKFMLFRRSHEAFVKHAGAWRRLAQF